MGSERLPVVAVVVSILMVGYNVAVEVAVAGISAVVQVVGFVVVFVALSVVAVEVEYYYIQSIDLSFVYYSVVVVVVVASIADSDCSETGMVD